MNTVTFVTSYTLKSGNDFKDFRITGYWCYYTEIIGELEVKRSCLLTRIGNYFEVEYKDITEQLNLLDEASKELNTLITY